MTEWTTTPPTQPGWYWEYEYHENYQSWYVVRVVKVKKAIKWQGLKRGDFAILDGEMGEVPIEAYPHRYWQGPIPQPPAPPVAADNDDLILDSPS